MKLFLTGITGYVGSVIAETFRARGHQVYGLVRTQEKAALMAAKGYFTILGDLRDEAALREGVSMADGVIHTAISHTPENEALDTHATRVMLDALSGSGKPFIYTSGNLIHNDTGETFVDEGTPVRPLPFLAWKAAMEQEVLRASAAQVRTIVLRPSLVYGRGSGIVRGAIENAKQTGMVRYMGDGANAWSTIDVDDLAELYWRAYHHAPAGSLYHATSRDVVTMRDLSMAIGRLLGLEDQVRAWSYEEASEVMGPAAWTMSISQRIAGKKAEAELQWRAKAHSLLHDLESGSYQMLDKTEA